MIKIVNTKTKFVMAPVIVQTYTNAQLQGEHREAACLLDGSRHKDGAQFIIVLGNGEHPGCHNYGKHKRPISPPALISFSRLCSSAASCF